jgi:hypothetical protein
MARTHVAQFLLDFGAIGFHSSISHQNSLNI